ncbi:hypothetical protein BD779DRAFT_1794965 [Infundibulicybe gibba]|nr:hypothetical protein BD779DRAFT_1794965 [Infundibulicybe gibba]
MYMRAYEQGNTDADRNVIAPLVLDIIKGTSTCAVYSTLRVPAPVEIRAPRRFEKNIECASRDLWVPIVCPFPAHWLFGMPPVAYGYRRGDPESLDRQAHSCQGGRCHDEALCHGARNHVLKREAVTAMLILCHKAAEGVTSTLVRFPPHPPFGGHSETRRAGGPTAQQLSRQGCQRNVTDYRVDTATIIQPLVTDTIDQKITSAVTWEACEISRSGMIYWELRRWDQYLPPLGGDKCGKQFTASGPQDQDNQRKGGIRLPRRSDRFPMTQLTPSSHGHPRSHRHMIHVKEKPLNDTNGLKRRSGTFDDPGT